MKFQCDRCKTRYSIGDDRVRGKILKIRCKNCEAVITVREGMDQPPASKPAAVAPRTPRDAMSAGTAPRVDSKPVLRGAFEKVMDSSSRAAAEVESDDERTVLSSAPSQLEQEWYVSHEGEQFGPFDLAEAQAWVAARPATDDLYCWSEGFDDWLPVGKVSHFRRRGGGDAGAPPIPAAAAASAGAGEVTPKPLFAATLAAMKQQERTAGAASATARADGPAADEPSDPALKFDIGEASRVVKLPMLAAALRPAERGSGAPLPGMAGDADGAHARVGTGTGGFASVSKVAGGAPVVVPLSEEALAAASPDVLSPPVRTRHTVAWYVAVGGGVLAAVGVVVAMLSLSSGTEDDGGGRLVRSRASAAGLGVSLDPRTIKIIETREVPAKGGGRRRPAPSPGARRAPSGGAAATTRGGLFDKSDDLDLATPRDDQRPLDGDDLLAVYRDNRLAVKLCYERALKKDPLLDVKKVYVSITVAPTGVVTKVLLSSHQNTPLGRCLVQRMRKWRFRKSSEVFAGRFPLVFRN